MDARSDPEAARRRALFLAATEPARTFMSAGTVAAALPLLRWAPRGEPHPVLVLPGLMASDLSTRVLRAWLGRLGYPVVGWALGRNRGPTKEVVDELPRLLDRLAAEHRTAVSIVGWSLGGIYARRLAKRGARPGRPGGFPGLSVRAQRPAGRRQPRRPRVPAARPGVDGRAPAHDR